MKRAFYYYIILFVCSFFYYSCKNSSNTTNQKSLEDSSVMANKIAPPPATVTISIIGKDIPTQGLDLRVNGINAKHLITTKNTNIKWIDSGAGIDIVDIAPDPDYVNTPDFFSPIPLQVGQHWEATVNPSLDETKYPMVKYYIKWKIHVTSSPVYNFDPLMQVNPIKIAPTEDTTHQ